MKYENFNTAKALVERIKEHTENLEILTSTDTPLTIIIKKGNYVLSTVGVGKSFEHPFSKAAQSFIDDCTQIVRDNLTSDNNKLEEL